MKNLITLGLLILSSQVIFAQENDETSFVQRAVAAGSVSTASYTGGNLFGYIGDRVERATIQLRKSDYIDFIVPPNIKEAKEITLKEAEKLYKEAQEGNKAILLTRENPADIKARHINSIQTQIDELTAQLKAYPRNLAYPTQAQEGHFEQHIHEQNKLQGYVNALEKHKAKIEKLSVEDYISRYTDRVYQVSRDEFDMTKPQERLRLKRLLEDVSERKDRITSLRVEGRLQNLVKGLRKVNSLGNAGAVAGIGFIGLDAYNTYIYDGEETTEKDFVSSSQTQNGSTADQLN